MGARRAARPRPRRSTSPARTRSTSSSAATPTTSSSVPSRPRSSTTKSADPPRAPALRRPRGPARRRRRRVLRPALALAYLERLESAGELRAQGRHATSCAAASDYPAARVLAALGLARALRDRRLHLAASCSAASRLARAFSTVHRGRHLPAPRALLRGPRARPRAPPGARRAVRRRLVHAAQARDRDARSSALLDRRETLGVKLVVRRDAASPRPSLAYQRRRLQDHAPVDLVTLDLPQTSFSTQALWYELDAGVLAGMIPPEPLLGSLHATEHAQIAVLPLLAMCDRWDIGGLSTNLHPQTGGPDDLHLRRPPRRRRHQPRSPSRASRSSSATRCG